MKKLSGVILALLSLLYPIGVYFGLSYFEPRYLILALVWVFAIRSIIAPAKNTSALQKWLFAGTLTAFTAVVFLTNSEQVLRFYPVIMNGLFFLVFALSCYYPPSMIQRAAQTMSKEPLTPAAITYTTRVTIAWCVFFLFNGSIAYYTTVFSSLAVWTLYNGFLSYCFMGLFFAAELIVRHFYMKKHHE